MDLSTTSTSLAAPPRLVSMLLCIHATPYKVNMKYVPGSDVKMGDVLSRVNPRNTCPIRGLAMSAHEVHVHLNASPTLIVETRMETSKDSTLHALCDIL